MGINGCVFQYSTILQPKLSADGSTCCKLLIKCVIIHGKCSTGFYINHSLYHRVIQCQFTTFFYYNADTAEHFHVCKCQITAVGDVQGLWNSSFFYLFPCQIITEVSIKSAALGAKPCRQLLRYTNALFFPFDIAAKVFDCPWLHNIPCIFSAGIVFQIFCNQFFCQCLFSGVYMKWKRIADCRTTLHIFD